jgi:hypothetical protein
MRPVWYKERKLSELSTLEYEALCLLLPYWGLQISEDGETVDGALSTFVLGIHGLSQQKVKELKQLLEHTEIRISTDDHVKCNQRFYVDFHAGHPMPLALNTPDKQLYYLNPAASFHLPVQSGIHKGITLKRKDGPLFLAVHPSFEEKIAEWISYLVIQSFLRFSFESLSSVSESTFFSVAEKVLQKMNSSFASVQVPQSHNENEAVEEVLLPKPEQVDTAAAKSKDADIFYEDSSKGAAKNHLDSSKVTVPQIRPFSAAGSLITSNVPKPFDKGQFLARNAQPINPFKGNSSKIKPIQPFQTNPSDPNKKSVIRPFQSNQNTPSPTREYNNKAPRLFRQRRDGK